MSDIPGPNSGLGINVCPRLFQCSILHTSFTTSCSVTTKATIVNKLNVSVINLSFFFFNFVWSISQFSISELSGFCYTTKSIIVNICIVLQPTFSKQLITDLISQRSKLLFVSIHSYINILRKWKFGIIFEIAQCISFLSLIKKAYTSICVIVLSQQPINKYFNNCMSVSFIFKLLNYRMTGCAFVIKNLILNSTSD